MEQWSKVYKGKSAAGGIAMGQVVIFQKKEWSITEEKSSDSTREVTRFLQAKEAVLQEFKRLHQRTFEELGEESATLFEVYQMILEAGSYPDGILERLNTEGETAEVAVKKVCDSLLMQFAQMEDSYIRERGADIEDISYRLVLHLQGRNTNDLTGGGKPYILLAEDLSPADTMGLRKQELLALVTRQGSATSHTAILARNRGIPAIVGLSINDAEWNAIAQNNMVGIVDGEDGIFYLNPSENLIADMQEKSENIQQKKAQLQDMKGLPSVTLDGKKILLYANVGNLEDVESAVENDAEGIGLFRSEFLYLEREVLPTEEEQFEIYKTALKMMGNRTAIVRTMDIGADKQCKNIPLPKEENPALGCRGVRVSLLRRNLFKVQLRALFRAAVFGDLQVMYPMITGTSELLKIRAIIEEVKTELTGEGMDFREPKQGIMIETPSAVMMSDELAKMVDFFSIGTNDLTQYTLAIDRQNASLDSFYDARHPSILRMIEMVVKNAHENGISVGICGELGGDLELTKTLLQMGVDELSVSPAKLLELRKHIRDCSLT